MLLEDNKVGQPLLKVGSPDFLHTFATLLSLAMGRRADHSPSERVLDGYSLRLLRRMEQQKNLFETSKPSLLSMEIQP